MSQFPFALLKVIYFPLVAFRKTNRQKRLLPLFLLLHLLIALWASHFSGIWQTQIQRSSKMSSFTWGKKSIVAVRSWASPMMWGIIYPHIPSCATWEGWEDGSVMVSFPVPGAGMPGADAGLAWVSSDE